MNIPPPETSPLAPNKVEYVTKVLQALFFLLALPYLILRLLSEPGATLKGATAAHAAA